MGSFKGTGSNVTVQAKLYTKLEGVFTVTDKLKRGNDCQHFMGGGGSVPLQKIYKVELARQNYAFVTMLYFDAR